MPAGEQTLWLREGSLVVWDKRQAHGSSPNAGPGMRLMQFVRYMPRDDYYQQLDSQSPSRVYARHLRIARRILRATGGRSNDDRGAPSAQRPERGLHREARELVITQQSLLHSGGARRSPERTTAAAQLSLPSLATARAAALTGPLQAQIAQQHADLLAQHGGRGWRLFDIAERHRPSSGASCGSGQTRRGWCAGWRGPPARRRARRGPAP